MTCVSGQKNENRRPSCENCCNIQHDIESHVEILILRCNIEIHIQCDIESYVEI